MAVERRVSEVREVLHERGCTGFKIVQMVLKMSPATTNLVAINVLVTGTISNRLPVNNCWHQMIDFEIDANFESSFGRCWHS